MHKAHHTKGDVHRLYIKRKKRGRGLSSTEEFVEDAIAGFHHYVRSSQERPISAAWRSSREQEQVVHQRRNEYNSQFVFFVEMNIMIIKERPLNISQNDNYDQS